MTSDIYGRTQVRCGGNWKSLEIGVASVPSKHLFTKHLVFCIAFLLIEVPRHYPQQSLVSLAESGVRRALTLLLG